MAVHIEHVKGHIDRIKSTVGDPRFADTQRTELIEVVAELCGIVEALMRDVEQLKRKG